MQYDCLTTTPPKSSPPASSPHKSAYWGFIRVCHHKFTTHVCKRQPWKTYLYFCLFLMFSQLGPVFLVLSIILGRSMAVEVNRTIDDTTGDSVTGRRPMYLPQTVGVWEDATCKGCAIQPDRARAFKGTWTAATYNPDLKSMSVELAFKGEL